MRKTIYKLTFARKRKFLNQASYDKNSEGIHREYDELPMFVVALNLDEAINKVNKQKLVYHEPYEFAATGEGIVL